MVNEISNVGLVSAQGLGYPAGAPSIQVDKNNAGSGPPQIRWTKTWQEPGKGAFYTMAASKDDAARVAKSIHLSDQALGQAGGLAKQIHQQVQIVKNYPPFPEGNESRINYLKGIEGLRKELEALTVPAVDNSQKPVFYPSESNLPPLDPKSASDAQVLAVGMAAEVVLKKINDGHEQLQAQAGQLSGKINDGLPQAPVNGPDAHGMSVAIAGLLGATRQSLAGNASAVAQLGG